MAEIISITTRRNALRLGAAATVVGLLAPVIAIAAPSADAELHALCRQFDDDSRAVQHYETMDLTGWTQADQDQTDILLLRVNATPAAIAAIQAITPAGIQAKAAALKHALQQSVIVWTKQSFEEQAKGHELLAMSLVRDLAAVPG